MRFMIRRAGAYSEETQPVPEAVRGTYTEIDERTASKPENIAAYKGQDPAVWWYGEGTNHRVERRHIMRDFPDQPAWFIEIPDLPALMKFYDQHGSFEITPCWFNYTIPMIQIGNYRD